MKRKSIRSSVREYGGGTSSGAMGLPSRDASSSTQQQQQQHNAIMTSSIGVPSMSSSSAAATNHHHHLTMAGGEPHHTLNPRTMAQASGAGAGGTLMPHHHLDMPSSSASGSAAGGEVKPRSLRFTWSMKTTSSMDPNDMMKEIRKVSKLILLV